LVNKSRQILKFIPNPELNVSEDCDNLKKMFATNNCDYYKGTKNKNAFQEEKTNRNCWQKVIDKSNV
jgi:hypothetical protein